MSAGTSAPACHASAAEQRTDSTRAPLNRSAECSLARYLSSRYIPHQVPFSWLTCGGLLHATDIEELAELFEHYSVLEPHTPGHATDPHGTPQVAENHLTRSDAGKYAASQTSLAGIDHTRRHSREDAALSTEWVVELLLCLVSGRLDHKTVMALSKNTVESRQKLRRIDSHRGGLSTATSFREVAAPTVPNTKAATAAHGQLGHSSRRALNNSLGSSVELLPMPEVVGRGASTPSKALGKRSSRRVSLIDEPSSTRPSSWHLSRVGSFAATGSSLGRHGVPEWRQRKEGLLRQLEQELRGWIAPLARPCDPRKQAEIVQACAQQHALLTHWRARAAACRARSAADGSFGNRSTASTALLRQLPLPLNDFAGDVPPRQRSFIYSVGAPPRGERRRSDAATAVTTPVTQFADELELGPAAANAVSDAADGASHVATVATADSSMRLPDNRSSTTHVYHPSTRAAVSDGGELPPEPDENAVFIENYGETLRGQPTETFRLLLHDPAALAQLLSESSAGRRRTSSPPLQATPTQRVTDQDGARPLCATGHHPSFYPAARSFVCWSDITNNLIIGLDAESHERQLHTGYFRVPTDALEEDAIQPGQVALLRAAAHQGGTGNSGVGRDYHPHHQQRLDTVSFTSDSAEDPASSLADKLDELHRQSADHVVVTSGRLTYILTGDKDGVVKLWDGRTGRFVRNVASVGASWIIGMQLLYDDQYLLLAAGDGSVALLQLHTNMIVRQFRGCISLTTAERKAVQPAVMDSVTVPARRFGLKTGECGPHRVTFQHVFSPKVFEMQRKAAQLAQHTQSLPVLPLEGLVWPTAACLEERRQWLFFGTAEGVVGYFNLAAGPTAAREHGGGRAAVLASRGSHRVAGAVQGHRPGTHVTGLFYSRAGDCLVSVGQDGCIVRTTWHAEGPSTPLELHAAPVFAPSSHSRLIRAVVPCDEGRMCVTVHSDRRALLWAVSRTTVELLHRYPQVPQGIRSACLTTSGERVAFLCDDLLIYVFDVRGTQPLAVMPLSATPGAPPGDLAEVVARASLHDADGCLAFTPTGCLVCALRGPVLYEPYAAAEPTPESGDRGKLPCRPASRGQPALDCRVTEQSAASPLVAFPGATLSDKKGVVPSLTGQSGVVDLVTHDTNHTLYCMYENVLCVWRLETGEALHVVDVPRLVHQEFRRTHMHAATAFGWSTDASQRLLVGAHEGIVATLDPGPPLVLNSAAEVLTGPCKSASRAALADTDISVVAHQGNLAVLCGGRSCVVRRYTPSSVLSSGEELCVEVTIHLPTRATITACCVLWDSHVCLGTNDARLYFYRLTGGESGANRTPYLEESFGGAKDNAVIGLVFVNDANQSVLLVTLESGTLFVYSPPRGATLTRVPLLASPQEATLRRVMYVQSARLLLVGDSRGLVHLWSVARNPAGLIEEQQPALALSCVVPAASDAITALGCVHLSQAQPPEVREGGERTSAAAQRAALSQSMTSCLSVTSRGSFFVVVGSLDGAARLYAVESIGLPRVQPDVMSSMTSVKSLQTASRGTSIAHYSSHPSRTPPTAARYDVVFVGEFGRDTWRWTDRGTYTGGEVSLSASAVPLAAPQRGQTNSLSLDLDFKSSAQLGAARNTTTTKTTAIATEQASCGAPSAAETNSAAAPAAIRGGEAMDEAREINRRECVAATSRPQDDTTISAGGASSPIDGSRRVPHAALHLLPHTAVSDARDEQKLRLPPLHLTAAPQQVHSAKKYTCNPLVRTYPVEWLQRIGVVHPLDNIPTRTPSGNLALLPASSTFGPRARRSLAYSSSTSYPSPPSLTAGSGAVPRFAADQSHRSAELFLTALHTDKSFSSYFPPSPVFSELANGYEGQPSRTLHLPCNQTREGLPQLPLQGRRETVANPAPGICSLLEDSGAVTDTTAHHPGLSKLSMFSHSDQLHPLGDQAPSASTSALPRFTTSPRRTGVFAGEVLQPPQAAPSSRERRSAGGGDGEVNFASQPAPTHHNLRPSFNTAQLGETSVEVGPNVSGAAAAPSLRDRITHRLSNIHRRHQREAANLHARRPTEVLPLSSQDRRSFFHVARVQPLYTMPSAETVLRERPK